MKVCVSRHVPQKCGEPRGPMINRPSIEYTGHGNDLCCFAWNGRYFRADREWVKEGCKKVVELVNGKDGEEGDYANVNTVQDFWGITCDDSGERFGWAPSEEWPYPCFTFDDCGPGTYLYDQFGETVFLISIPTEASPYECYWEV